MGRSDSRRGKIRSHSERCNNIFGTTKDGKFLDSRGKMFLQLERCLCSWNDVCAVGTMFVQLERCWCSWNDVCSVGTKFVQMDPAPWS